MTRELEKLSRGPQGPISSNGQEIWDWAARLGAERQRAFRLAELDRDIAKIGRRCGDCDHWMKSRICPKEVNVNGRNRGPSGDHPICGKFAEDRSATKRSTELQAERAALKTGDAP